MFLRWFWFLLSRLIIKALKSIFINILLFGTFVQLFAWALVFFLFILAFLTSHSLITVIIWLSMIHNLFRCFSFILRQLFIFYLIIWLHSFFCSWWLFEVIRVNLIYLILLIWSDLAFKFPLIWIIIYLRIIISQINWVWILIYKLN